MAIEKINAANLRKIGLHYTVIPSEVLQLIKNPDSVAIWVYLMTQSEGWIVRPTDLKKRFNLGKIRYLSAMDELRSLGLCYAVIIRDEKGQIAAKTMVCSNVPPDWLGDSTIRAENVPHGDNHRGGLTTRWMTPPGGQSTHLTKDQLTNEELKDTNNGQNDFDQVRQERTFDAFWKVWKNKKKKQEAKKIWLKKITTKDLATKIINHVSERNLNDAQWKKDNGQYIPHPTTFLNGALWDDIYEVSPTSTQGIARSKAMARAKDTFEAAMFEEDDKVYTALPDGRVIQGGL